MPTHIFSIAGSSCGGYWLPGGRLAKPSSGTRRWRALNATRFLWERCDPSNPVTSRKKPGSVSAALVGIARLLSTEIGYGVVRAARGDRRGRVPYGIPARAGGRDVFRTPLSPWRRQL